MFKLTLTTNVLLVSWAISFRCVAQTFDANAAFKLNELGGSETTPFFGPFSVGFTENFGDFNSFTAAEHTNAFAGNANTEGFLTLNNVSVPAAVVNVSCDDYIFNNSAGNNTPNGSPFSITGLNDAIIADLYFYGSFGSQAFTVNGAPSGGVFGAYHGLEATAFFNVPVTAGEITGLFGVAQTGVLGGLSISSYTVVPEPAAHGFALAGGMALLLVRRRHS